MPHVGRAESYPPPGSGPASRLRRAGPTAAPAPAGLGPPPGYAPGRASATAVGAGHARRRPQAGRDAAAAAGARRHLRRARSGSSASTRRRPSASAVLVAAVAMAIPVLVTAVLTPCGRTCPLDAGRRRTPPTTDRHRRGGRRARRSARVLQYVGLIFVTGMIAHVTAAAAIGRRLSLGEAWAATRGTRWRLVGLTAAHRPDLAGRARRRTSCVWVAAGRARRLVGRSPWSGSLVSVPLSSSRWPVLALDPGHLPAGAGADARADRRLRRHRPRLPADPPAVLAHLRHRACSPS